MVGGRNRITVYDETKIIEMLTNYHERRARRGVFGTKDAELDFLDKCLNNILPHERELLEKTYIQHISLRRFSMESGISRTTLTKKRTALVKLIVAFFNMAAGQLK